jgi:dUTP pyrophosphatase
MNNKEELVLVKLEAGAVLPSLATPDDAGYDLVAISDPLIKGIPTNNKAGCKEYRQIDYIEYDTGVSICPELGMFSCVFPRSSISKTNLFLANSIGLIDNGYRGTIKLRFKYSFPAPRVRPGSLNSSIILDRKKIYQKGDRIGQIVFFNTQPVEFVVKEELPTSDRGGGGFGSTGK